MARKWIDGFDYLMKGHADRRGGCIILYDADLGHWSTSGFVYWSLSLEPAEGFGI